MQALPWLPRPLIIFAMICGKVTPCVQWHGQDSEGNITDEQMLFPIYGHEAKYIECVRPELWMVRFLGSIDEWNRRYPNRPWSLFVNGKIKEDCGSVPIIRLFSNELFSHATFSQICSVVSVGEDGVLYSPATYENLEAQEELPRLGLDANIQEKWRKAYLNPDCLDIKQEVERVVDMLDLFSDMYSRRYHHWLRTGTVWHEQRW